MNVVYSFFTCQSLLLSVVGRNIEQKQQTVVGMFGLLI
jgi:hypothetical protein